MYRIVFMILLAIVAVTGCSQGDQNTSLQVREAPPITVRTAPVEQMTFPVKIEIGGSLLGDRQTVIIAKTQSTVDKILVRRGQAVHTGEILVMLDPGGVQSQYRQAEAVYLNAEKQWKRMTTLYEAGAISETQLDNAETQYEVAKANFSAARQTVEITAPFAGIVTDLHIQVGDEVAPGLPLLEMADTGALRLLLEVPTDQIARIKKGQTVKVVSASDSSQVMTGQVMGIADAASTQTRSFEVECRFPSPIPGFAPGVYVIAEIEIATLESVLVVPNDALLYRTGEALIYVVQSDTVALVPVNVLAEGRGQTAVSGALTVGQRVVVVGQKVLTPGARVREAAI